jgi:hypothetical protein
VPTGLPRLRPLMPWPLVALGLLAACLTALFGPFGQIHCTSYVPPTNQAAQIPATLGSHSSEVWLCTNVSFRGAFYGAP